MKKYKLIKEYPASDSLGTIITGSKETMYSKGLGFRNYDWAHVETHPEYWEEVVEKDYEIISFKQDSGITDLWTKFTGGWSRNINGYPTTVPYTLEDILKNDLYTIHSVKRLSDGEVFTVGDTLEGICGRPQKIEKFYLNKENEMCVYTDITCRFSLGYLKAKQPEYEILSYVAKDNPNNITTKRRGGELHDSYWNIHSVKRLSDGEVFTVGDRAKVYECGSIKTIDSMTLVTECSSMKKGIWLNYNSGSSHIIHAIKQVKQPVSLTHDGKDIFEENKVWYVNKENLYHDYIIAYPEVKFYSDINVYFLTREAAEDYIQKNKVLFITEDGVGIKKGDTYYCVNTAPHLWSLFEQTSKERTQLNKTVKAFSTYEAAQYYVIVNAKVLSIEEFWEFVSKPGSNIVKQKALKRLVKERLNLK